MRSDQRRPPRATLPNRRCTPSTRGEYTKISYLGRGSGSTLIAEESSLMEMYGLRPPSTRWKALVRSVARIISR